jgi:hypothetical protein
MNGLPELLSSFDLSILFSVTYDIAEVVAKYLSPVLLIIAIYIRLMETQIDALTGSGKYGTALRDILFWGFVLGAYYAIGALIMDFFNTIYAWLDSFGSLKATMAAYDNIMTKNALAINAKGVTALGLLSSPYVLVSSLLYYGTLIVVAFISAFLKIANVMAFGVAFIWGLIAIPISISTTFKILRGWAYLLAMALVWPIIQALLMAMFSMLFTNSANILMGIPDADPILRGANIMMLFAVMNLLFAAILISAPLIANALVTNSSAASGIVMPFVAAAVAAGVATIKDRNAIGLSSSSPAASAKIPGGLSMPAPRMNAARSAFANNGHTETPAAAAAAPVLTDSAPGAATQARKQRQRKGVLINQLKNRNTKKSGGA